MAEENDKLEQLRKAFGEKFYKKIRGGEKPTLDELLMARAIDQGGPKRVYMGAGNVAFAGREAVEVSPEMAAHVLGSSKFSVTGKPTGDYTMIPLLPIVKKSGQDTTPLMLASRGNAPKIFVKTGKLLPEREGMEPYVFTKDFVQNLAGERSLDQSVYLPFVKRDPFQHGEIVSAEKPQVVVDSKGNIRLTSSQRIYPESEGVDRLTYEVTGYRVGDKRYSLEEIVEQSRRGFYEGSRRRTGIQTKPEPIIKLRLRTEAGQTFEQEFDVGQLEAEERKIIRGLSDVKAGDKALDTTDDAVRRMATQYVDQLYGGQIAQEINRNLDATGRKLSEFTINDSEVFFDLESVSRPTQGDFYITQMGVARGEGKVSSVLPVYMFEGDKAAREALEYTIGVGEAGNVARRMINIVGDKSRIRTNERLAYGAGDIRRALGLTGGETPRLVGYNITGFDIPALVEKGIITKQEADELDVLDLYKVVRENRRAIENVYGIDLSEGLSLENVYTQLYRRFEGKMPDTTQAHEAGFDVQMTRYVTGRLRPFVEAREQLKTPTARLQQQTEQRLERTLRQATSKGYYSPLGQRYSFDPMGRLIRSPRISKARLERGQQLNLFEEGTYAYSRGHIRGTFDVAGKDAILTIENAEDARTFKPYFEEAKQLDRMTREIAPRRMKPQIAGEVSEFMEAMGMERIFRTTERIPWRDVAPDILPTKFIDKAGDVANSKYIAQAYAFMGELAQKSGMVSSADLQTANKFATEFAGQYKSDALRVFSDITIGQMYAEQLGGEDMVKLLSAGFGIRGGAQLTAEGAQEIAGVLGISSDKAGYYYKSTSRKINRPLDLSEIVDTIRKSRDPRTRMLLDIFGALPNMFRSSDVNITPEQIRNIFGVSFTDVGSKVEAVQRGYNQLAREIFTTYQRSISDLAESVGDTMYTGLKRTDIDPKLVSEFANALSQRFYQGEDFDFEGAVDAAKVASGVKNLTEEQVDVLRRLSAQALIVEHAETGFQEVSRDIGDETNNLIDQLGIYAERKVTGEGNEEIINFYVDEIIKEEELDSTVREDLRKIVIESDNKDLVRRNLREAVLGSRQSGEFIPGGYEEAEPFLKQKRLSKAIYSDSYLPPTPKMATIGRQQFQERMSDFLGESTDINKVYGEYTKLYNRFLWAELNTTYNTPGGLNVSVSFDQFISRLDDDYADIGASAAHRASQDAFLVMRGAREFENILQGSSDRAFMEIAKLNRLLKYRRQLTNQSEAVAGFTLSATNKTITIGEKTYDVSRLMNAPDEISQNFIDLFNRAHKIQGIGNTPIAQMASNVGLLVEMAKHPELVQFGDRTLDQISGEMMFGGIKLNDLLRGQIEGMDIGSFVKLSSYSPELLAAIYGVQTTDAMLKYGDIEENVLWGTMDISDLGEDVTEEEVRKFYKLQQLVADEMEDVFYREGEAPDAPLIRAMMGMQKGRETPPEVMYTFTKGMEVTRGNRRYTVESWENTNVILRDIKTDELTAVNTGTQKIHVSEKSFSALFSNVYAEAKPSKADMKAQEELVNMFYDNFYRQIEGKTPEEMMSKAPEILQDYRAFTRLIHGYSRKTKKYSVESLMSYVSRLKSNLNNKGGDYTDATRRLYGRILTQLQDKETAQRLINILQNTKGQSIEKAISEFGYLYGTDAVVDQFSLNASVVKEAQEAFDDQETRKLAEKMGIDISKEGKETTQQAMKKMDYNFWRQASRYAPLAIGMFGFFGMLGAMSSVQAKQQAEQAKQQQVMNTISLTPSLAKQMRYQPSQPEVSAAINAENTTKEQLTAYTQALGMSNAHVRYS